MGYYDEISELGQEAMKEIGSIGTGNASTALSKLLNIKVEMALPEVKMLKLQEVVSYVGNAEEEVSAVLSELSKDISGVMLFILDLEFINTLTESMFQKTYTAYEELDEMACSVITEVGNIVNSAYVTALSQMTEFDIHLSVPSLTMNMLGGILNIPLTVVGNETNHLMLVTGKFMIGETHHEASLFLVPDEASLMKVLKKVGVL